MKLINFKISSHKNYLAIILVIFFTHFYYLNLVNFLNTDLIAVGGDLSYELVPIKIAYDGDLFGFTTNLGWPNGFATWAYPTMGFGTILSAWIFGLLPFSLSIYFVYFFVAILGNLLNSVAIYWAFQAEFRNKLYPTFFSVLIGISPLIYYRFGHMPVIWFYLIVIIIGVLIKFERNQLNLSKIFLIVLVAGIFSPFWWNVVGILISLSLIIIYLINYKKNQINLKFWFTILTSIIVSLLPTFVLYLHHRDLVGPSGRNPWQSNVFGGRLSDLLVASPYLNQNYYLLEKLNEGVSPEARITQFGLVLTIFAIAALIYLASSYITKFDYLPKNLGIFTFFIFIFFLLGGLGNLQASILFLMNQISPARSWSRLIIFLSIIGAFILFKFLEEKNIRTKLFYPIIIFLIFISFIDLSFASKPTLTNKNQVEGIDAIRFIEENTKDCPILQLPLDTYPIPQDFLFENGGKFVYNEFIPYLISDKNQWSIGGTPGNRYWLENLKIPRTIELSILLDLDKKGFCAILFDKDYANWQINRNAGIDPKTGALTNWGNWPGVEIKGISPNFQDNRFEVYLIK